MLSALESLPPELLENIIGHLDNDLLWLDRVTGLAEHRTSLLSVSSVSRTLRLACDPFVFRVFPSKSFCEPIRPFLRSLCERPGLSRYVWNLWIPLDDDGMSILSEEDRPLFTATMGAFSGFDWYQRVLTALLNGCHKAEAVLLLGLCSKLRELRLGVDDDPKTAEFCDLRSDKPFCQHCDGFPMADCVASLLATPTPFSYRELKTVEVYDSEQYQEESDHPVISGLPGPLLKLPHLEKLGMSHCRIQDLQDPFLVATGEEANKLNLKSLKLGDCEVDGDQVATLMRSCRALEVVTITWNEETPTNISALFAGLEMQHDSLRNLEIGNYGSIDVGDLGAFDTLHLFQSLRSLSINHSLLIGDVAWDFEELTVPKFPDELGVVTLHCESSIEDLDTILTVLMPQMTDIMFDHRLTFPIHEANLEYVDMIHATDLAPWPRSHTDEKSWTMHLSRSDGSSLFIVFCCWMTRTKSIAQTLHDLLQKLAAVGTKGALESHFERCEIDEAEAELLQNLRDIVKMAWQVAEE